MPLLFGDDIDCGPDGLSPTFELVSERDALVQAILHRFQTQRGSLIDDKDYGLEVQAWVGKRVDTTQLWAWQQALEGEARKDQRVLSARARLTFDTISQLLSFTLAVETAEGPFTLTVAVSELSVDLLAVS